MIKEAQLAASLHVPGAACLRPAPPARSVRLRRGGGAAGRRFPLFAAPAAPGAERCSLFADRLPAARRHRAHAFVGRSPPRRPAAPPSRRPAAPPPRRPAAPLPPPSVTRHAQQGARASGAHARLPRPLPLPQTARSRSPPRAPRRAPRASSLQAAAAGRRSGTNTSARRRPPPRARTGTVYPITTLRGCRSTRRRLRSAPPPAPSSFPRRRPHLSPSSPPSSSSSPPPRSPTGGTAGEPRHAPPPSPY